MSRLLLFYRLIVRPVFREPVRTSLTVLAIALGVAVVLAIDLAGTAAAGSFRSSMETLAGENDLEIVTAGGVPENVVGTLNGLPYPLRITPRIEDYAIVAETKQTLPLIGLDLVAEASEGWASSGFTGADDAWKYLAAIDSVWVGESLGRKSGQTIALLINDQVATYTVRGVFPDANGNTSAIVMDISAAQFALKRFGRVDRILIRVPQSPNLEEWQRRLGQALPSGVQVRAADAGTNEMSIQLQDNTELMLFHIRRKDGSIDPYSSGTFVDARGEIIHLRRDEFTLKPAGATWMSPATRAVYPVRWKISVPKLGIALEASTSLPAQEWRPPRDSSLPIGKVP